MGKGPLGFCDNERAGKSRKKGYVHNLDQITTSFFFTNILSEVKTTLLWQLFAKYGKMGRCIFHKN